MPGKVGVKIKAGRNLPVMDRGSDTTDAYVEIKLGNVTHKTDVCRKSLNPQWNTDWFRFEVDDADLQDEPLQIRLMDHDTYSANDAIGKVYINLNPLCLETASQSNQGKGAVMSGWIPVFDTMHGIRGEVNIIIKVDLFSDANKFRQSSCGIQFFHSPNIPHGYKAQVIHGFVEELVVNDDPEYQWIDKIRTPRASNEARQVVFLKLSGQVQRKIGLKAINLGANSVIGYTQCFDLEGDVGVVARGIGTAVTLVKIQDAERVPSLDNTLIEERTLKYLEFLKGNDNLENCNKSVFDFDTSNDNSGNLVYKILGIHPVATERTNAKSPNLILNQRWKPRKDDIVIPEESEDGETMSKLLLQEDLRGEKPTKKFRHHVKHITRSSKNLFSEKLNVLKFNKDKFDKRGADNISLNSSTSDLSESLKNSLSDLRSMIKFKRSKKGNFNRSISDGSNMASLLVNSVIRGTSLDSISEGLDSARSTPNNQKAFHNEIKSESISNLSTVSKLQQNTFESEMSVSEVSSSKSSTSSTTEERFSDELSTELTTPNEIVVVDADTVSMVVKSVLAQESNEKDSENWIYPGSTKDENDDDDDDDDDDNIDEQIFNKTENTTGVDSKEKKSLDGEHNQQTEENKTIYFSAGAVRVSKTGKNTQSTEIITKDIQNKTELDNVLKETSSDQDSDNWIQPGSTTDEPETIDERRGSLLHDLRENISEKFHHFQEHIHLPHFNGDKNKLQKHKTVDDNIILPSSIEKFHNQQSRRGSFDGIIKKLHFSFDGNKNKNSDILNRNDSKESNAFENAMRVILMEPLNLADEIEKSVKQENQIARQNQVGKSIENENKTNQESKNKSNLITTQKSTITNFKSETKTEDNKVDANKELFSQLKTNHRLKLSSLSSQCHPIIIVNDDTSFYFSEPELFNDSSYLSPSTSVKMNSSHFTSLTNLSANKINSNLLKPMPVHNNLNNSISCLSIPSSALISPCSSNSATKPLTLLDNSFLHPSIIDKHSNILNSEIAINNNSNYDISNKTIRKKSLEISSSDTNLSITNKAQTLAPFPYLKQHRSSGLTATTTNQTAANMNIASSTKLPIATPSAIPSTIIKSSTSASNDSINSGSKLSQSPSKHPESSTLSASNMTSNKEKEKCDSTTGSFRRSSDSDLSVTPKGNSLCVASERLVAVTTSMRSSVRGTTVQENFDMLEYPFLTLAKYPYGFILHLGATVAARSVKLLERVPNPDEPETRDQWWTELRMEIRSHARALNCNVILGYSEVTTISDDVCVLSATGTAAVINMSYNGDVTQFDLAGYFKKDFMISSLDERDCSKETKLTTNKTNTDTIEQQNTKELSSSLGKTITTATTTIKPPFYGDRINYECSLCHIPYKTTSIPFNVKIRKCSICKRGKVPDVLLATIEIPESMQITGRGCFIQAQVLRTKKDLRSESNAKEISDGLPFLEYELHRLLINKLKAKGMNAIFGLKLQIAIGEKMMALLATGTAVYLTALPPPTVPKIVATNSWTDMNKLKELQKSLQETVEKNREIYQLKCITDTMTNYYQNGGRIAQEKFQQSSDTDDSDDEMLRSTELDLTTGNKDTCVLEVDDIEDLEIISSLMESCPPDGFHIVNTQSVPGLQELEVVNNTRMFTQIWKAKLCVGQNSLSLSRHFQRLLQIIFFKLRTMIPCAICDLRFKLDLPESDEIQILVTGMVVSLAEITKFSKLRRKTLSSVNDSISQQTINGTGGAHIMSNRKQQQQPQQDDDLIFSLDEDNQNNVKPLPYTKETNVIAMPATSAIINSPTSYGTHSLRLRKGSPSRMKSSTSKNLKNIKERYGVDITPLSYVPGGRIEKYLGNLNFFFIRESTSIRENGGISGFVHSFITELLGVVRAHVAALGGNAMVSFYMTELLLVDNQHKNQGQCLVSVGGDVVYVSYYSDD